MYESRLQLSGAGCPRHPAYRAGSTIDPKAGAHWASCAAARGEVEGETFVVGHPHPSLSHWERGENSVPQRCANAAGPRPEGFSRPV